MLENDINVSFDELKDEIKELENNISKLKLKKNLVTDIRNINNECLLELKKLHIDVKKDLKLERQRNKQLKSELKKQILAEQKNNQDIKNKSQIINLRQEELNSLAFEKEIKINFLRDQLEEFYVKKYIKGYNAKKGILSNAFRE